MAYDSAQTTISKFLSLLLRHHPEFLDLNMNSQGWVEVGELLDKINYDRSYNIYFSNLQYIVKSDSKQRFELKKMNGRYYIRAQYGHSIKGLDLGYAEVEPPKILYHGTAEKSIESIFKHGLLPLGREFVHLTTDIKKAQATGMRHGKPVVLEVAAKNLCNNGGVFYQAENGVWLTKYVEPEFLKIIGKD